VRDAGSFSFERIGLYQGVDGAGTQAATAGTVRATDVEQRKKLKEGRFEMNTNKPSIVFCHGIWADGSSFGKVIPPLQADGYEVMAAQYGLDTPEGDVATVKRTLGRVSGPTILVGHSSAIRHRAGARGGGVRSA
jgi:pimeloyl-ACP methyl ester carboxylesterase